MALLYQNKVEALNEQFLNQLEKLGDCFAESILNSETLGKPLSFSAGVAKTGVTGMMMKLRSPLLGGCESTIITFINKSRKHWTSVKGHDLSFLRKECFSLFEGLDEKYLLQISSLFDDDQVVTPSLLERMWDALENLCVICVKIIHWKRVGILPNGKEGYANKFFPKINPCEEHPDGDEGISVKSATELFKITTYEP